MAELWKEILISLGASSMLALLAIYKKALTPKAVLLAWVLSVVITFCGGLASFAVLAATFIFTILAGKIGHTRREIEKSMHAKTGKRDAVQVFCNVGVGAFLLLFYFLTEDSPFLLSYGVVMAASLGDSLASELGILAHAEPVDICTFSRTQRGLSGGVTLLGCFASLLGAALIGLTYVVCIPGGLYQLLFITAGGFTGAVIDSILGSRLQVKYQCPICGGLTEKKWHCDTDTRRYRGFTCINNDIVNFLSNLSVALLSLAALYLAA